MYCHRIVFMTFWILGYAGGAALAQDEDKPVALIRQTPETVEYFIKVQTNAKLPQGSKLSVVLSNKNNLVLWEENVTSCAAVAPSKPCQQVTTKGLAEIFIPLSQVPQPPDKYRVSFAISDGAGKGSFRSIDVIPDLKASGPRSDLDCKNGLIVDVQSDATLDDATEISYFETRMKELDKWLKTNKANPPKIAKVRIEPLTKANISEQAISSFSVSPAVEGQSHNMDLDVARALAFQKASVCIQFHERLPSEKFNAEVTFQNTPPLELEKPLTKALPGATGIATPSASSIPDENKLGLRSLENNLDLGFLYTSAVKDVKKEDQTVRERQNRGSLDLRFAPSIRGRMRPPEVKKWQPFWTPVFIDAKISTGSVSEETLSLNRILFGTEVAFRYVQGTTRGQRDKYVITLRGTNASDRDYNQAEVKGELEFRPIFETLNQPLRIRRASVPAVLVPDSPQKEVPSGGFLGYQIQPFVGIEAGWRYRERRPTFKAEEQSDAVRRLRFGIDIAFNLTPRLTLTLTDIFYLRGESPGDRKRNYFSSIIEAPLGNLSRNAAQSVYFSFERGNQPPFSTAGVNALKFGYRIKSDFFAGGPSR